MNLFDEINRFDRGPASHSEDSYSYYNRSARPGAISIRALLQAWFDHYPASDQPELAARFRADFESAFFELFLHEAALRLGIAVRPHPFVDASRASRPDFHLDESGASSYMEARVARDESAETRNRRKVLATIYDQINKLEVPDFFLRIAELQLLSTRQPSARRFGPRLVRWINTLDYEAMVEGRNTISSLDDLPTWEYRDDAIQLRISASPVSREHRGAPGHRPIGIYPFENRWGGAEASLRRALQRKGTKFGMMAAPYIIAVNSLSSWSFDRIDQMEALFGNEQFVIGPEDVEPEMIRKANGFWYGPSGPRHTRVSGVLFCQVSPWNVHAARYAYTIILSLPLNTEGGLLHFRRRFRAKRRWNGWMESPCSLCSSCPPGGSVSSRRRR